MAVVVADGSFTIASSDTTKTVSGLAWDDGGSHTPQLVRFFCRQVNGTGNSTGDFLYARGAMTAGEQACIHRIFRDNVNAVPPSRGYFTASHCLLERNNTGAVTGTAEFSSFGTNQFVLGIADQFAGATTTVHYRAYANADNVFIKTDQTPTVTGSFSRSDIGFQPDVLWLELAGTENLDSNSNGAGGGSFGFVDANANQFCVGLTVAGTSNYTFSSVRTDRLGVDPSFGAPPNSGLSAAAGWQDPTGYTLSMDEASGAALRYFAICLKGGTAKVGTFAAQTVTGNYDVTTPGLNPTSIELLSRPGMTASTANGTSPAEFTHGWGYSSTVRTTFWALNQDNGTLGGATVTECYSREDDAKILADYDDTGVDTITAAAEADLVSLGAGKFTLNQTDAAPAADLVGYLAFGTPQTGWGALLSSTRNRLVA